MLSRRPLNERMLDAFLNLRLREHLSLEDHESLRHHLLGLLQGGGFPAYRGRWIDVYAMAAATGIDPEILISVRAALQPLCDAICRAAADGRTSRPPVARDTVRIKKPARQGRPPKPVVERPKPLWSIWSDPPTFAEALRLHMARHGDGLRPLHTALSRAGRTACLATLGTWTRGVAIPTNADSLATLSAIEQRYGLPSGYFDAKIERRARFKTERGFVRIPPSENRRLAWHLPDDFARRTVEEQEEILTWVREVVISGSTDYRRYQSIAMRHRYALRFVGLRTGSGSRAGTVHSSRSSALVPAPKRLHAEMTDLLRFKTATLASFGLRRNGVWNAETAAQKVEHLALLFGALVADPDGEIAGHGAPLERGGGGREGSGRLRGGRI